MTSENLASMAGIIFSLSFSYIPGLNTKFARLGAEQKRLIMAGMLVIVAGAVYGLSCTDTHDRDQQRGELSLTNPEGLAIIVTRLVLDITAGSTGIATLDAGIEANGTTSADNLGDGLSA